MKRGGVTYDTRERKDDKGERGGGVVEREPRLTYISKKLFGQLFYLFIFSCFFFFPFFLTCLFFSCSRDIHFRITSDLARKFALLTLSGSRN